MFVIVIKHRNQPPHPHHHHQYHHQHDHDQAFDIIIMIFIINIFINIIITIRLLTCWRDWIQTQSTGKAREELQLVFFRWLLWLLWWSRWWRWGWWLSWNKIWQRFWWLIYQNIRCKKDACSFSDDHRWKRRPTSVGRHHPDTEEHSKPTGNGFWFNGLMVNWSAR